MNWFHLLLTVAIIAFTGVCAILDWRTRRIPNYLTVPMFFLGVLACTIKGGFGGLWSSLLGFAIGFGLLLLLFLFGASGGGDVKMMGALGAWLGPWQTLLLFVASAGATIVLICVITLYRAVVKNPAEKKTKNKRAARDKKADPFQTGRMMTYAVPVSLGAWVILAYAWMYHTLPLTGS